MCTFNRQTVLIYGLHGTSIVSESWTEDELSKHETVTNFCWQQTAVMQHATYFEDRWAHTSTLIIDDPMPLI